MKLVKTLLVCAPDRVGSGAGAGCQLPVKAASEAGSGLSTDNPKPASANYSVAGFTMVEIAICLAIIGIALVGIIGVLPIGLNTQRATREETVINQDVAVLLPIIKQGSTGADDLTNYVYAITNDWTLFKADGSVNVAGHNGYIGYNDGNAPGVSITGTTPYPNSPYSSTLITNGANIVGLLSTPEYTYPNGAPAANLSETTGYSNHITAYVRSMSGLAAEKPPQNSSSILVEDAFGYQIVIVNAPVALDTNNFNTFYNKQLWQNQRELRMTYHWPQLPNGKTGSFSQTFRATIAGQLGTNLLNGQFLYFYQPQTFGVNPN
jgi:prepilin-type N-terminal cleavage/methylation domain-containing protein